MPSVKPYATRGGIEPKPSYGLTIKYLSGKLGETGFGSASSAEQVAANWDGKGVVALVTGAAAGLGYESARVLAKRGAHVVVAVRSKDRAEETAARLRADVPGAQVTPLELDLSSLASVRQAAEAYKRSGLPLHILMLNAGVMAVPQLSLSKDGYEMQWATNHLGHFALTQQLRDLMVASARSSGKQGRVVVLSSMGHHLFEVPGGVDFEALRTGKDYEAFKAYGVSKLSNILFTRELQRQLEGEPVAAVCCHPGVIFETELKRHMVGISDGGGGGRGGSTGGGIRSKIMKTLNDLFITLQFIMFRPISKSVPQGAATQVFLATSPDVLPGEYYSDCNVAQSSAASHDGELGARLWAFSEQAVKQAEEEAAATS